MILVSPGGGIKWEWCCRRRSFITAARQL